MTGLIIQLGSNTAISSGNTIDNLVAGTEYTVRVIATNNIATTGDGLNDPMNDDGAPSHDDDLGMTGTPKPGPIGLLTISDGDDNEPRGRSRYRGRRWSPMGPLIYIRCSGGRRRSCTAIQAASSVGRLLSSRCSPMVTLLIGSRVWETPRALCGCTPPTMGAMGSLQPNQPQQMPTRTTRRATK